MDLEFSVVDVVNFYKCHPVVPLVEGHVFGVQLAKTTHAPSRGHISVEVAFVVFACLVVVTAHCGGLRAHVQTAGGVNRRRRTTASKLVAVNKVQASRLGHTFPVNEFTPQSLEAEKVFESPLVHVKKFGGLDSHVPLEPFLVVAEHVKEPSVGEVLSEYLQDIPPHLQLFFEPSFAGVLLKSRKGIKVKKVSPQEDRVRPHVETVLNCLCQSVHRVEGYMDIVKTQNA